MKANLKKIIDNDTYNAMFLGDEVGRKETAQIPNTRIDKNNQPIQQMEITFATDACAKCGNRSASMKRCARCKKSAYCGEGCQKSDWPTHKSQCKAQTSV